MWIDAANVLVSTGFTRADGHRLVAAALDAGNTLTTIFVSRADLAFYCHLDEISDTFPEITILATPIVIDHVTHTGGFGRWRAYGAPPSQLVEPLMGGHIYLEGHRFGPRRAHLAIPERHYVWHGACADLWSGVLLFDHSRVWTAGSPVPDVCMAWVEVLDQMNPLTAEMMVAHGVSTRGRTA